MAEFDGPASDVGPADHRRAEHTAGDDPAAHLRAAVHARVYAAVYALEFDGDTTVSFFAQRAADNAAHDYRPYEPPAGE